MPVFALKLEFDDKGSVVAVRRFGDIAKAAHHAQDSTSRLEKAITTSMKGAAKNVLGLVAAYTSLQKAMSFVERGVKFNASIESSKIGLASIITSMATLQDSQGHILDGAEKYAAAQEVAAQMMKRIQVLGLETSATTQELVQGVQSVLGPALQAGLKLEQIPDFALNAAQAMQTMSIPLQQMRTEIEALLSGNINKAQDLLAPRLGLNKETINRWKAEGTYYENVMKALEAYKRAGKDVAQTLTGLLSNLDEALDVVSGQISEGLTAKLKEAVRTAQTFFISTESGGTGVGKNFEHLAELLGEIETSLGQGILSAIEAVVDGLTTLNATIGEVGAGEVLDDMSTAIKTTAVALAALIASRKAYNSVTLQGIKAEVEAHGAFGTLREKIMAADEALQKQIQSRRLATDTLVAVRKAEYEAALAADQEAVSRVKTAQAAVNATAQQKIYTTSTVEAIKAENRHEQALLELSAAQNQAARTSAILASSQKQLAGAELQAAKAAKGARVLTTAFSGLKTVGSRLFTMFGGPWGVALTAGTAALGYLATKQTEAEKATNLHSQALHTLNDLTTTAAQQNKTLAENLGEVAEAHRRDALDKEGEALKGYARALDDVNLEFADFLLAQSGKQPVNEMTESLKKGIGSWEEYSEALGYAYNELQKAGKGNSQLAKELYNTLTQIAEPAAKSEQNIRALNGEIQGLEASAQEAADANSTLAASIAKLNALADKEPKTLEEAVAWLDRRTASTLSAKDAKEKDAKATDASAMALLRESAALAQVAYASSLLKNYNSPEEREAATKARLADLMYVLGQIEKFETGLNDLYAGRTGGSKGVSSINTAREAFQRIREEVEQLNGTSLAGANDLAKKLHEIGEQGKKAGESADSIAKLKNAYIEAFNAQRVREFSDALRDVNAEIASLSGDTATERLIENSRRMEAAIEQLYGNLALPSPEATGEAGAAQWGTLTKQLVEAGTAIFGLGKGLAESNQTEDLQTSVDFYRELRELSGKYTLGLAEQNRLIELQAELYRRNHIPEQLIKEWELLQKLQNDTTGWGGVRRAARAYYADSMNWGKQFEGLTTSIMDNFVDTMTDGLMKGKLSFSDFADSLIRDIMRISLQASTARIMESLIGNTGSKTDWGGLFGQAISTGLGMLGKGGSSSAASAIQNFKPNFGAGLAKPFAMGGIVESHMLSAYSGSVVSKPTFFDYRQPGISAFARGGVGLMGEAGPEAILPVEPLGGGRYGLRASYPDSYAELRELLDNSPARRINAELAETTRKYMEVIRERGQQAAQERAQAAAPKVNVIINNNAPGVEVEQEQRQNSDGSLDIIATVKRVVAQDMARRGGQTNQVLRKGFGLNPIITRR